MINSKVMEQVKTLKYLRNTILIYGHMDLKIRLIILIRQVDQLEEISVEICQRTFN